MIFGKVNYLTAPAFLPGSVKSGFRAIRFVFLLILAACAVHASPAISTSDDDKTVIINDAPEQQVYVFGKSVEVRGNAKGVLAIGGDVHIHGNVEGDVGTIGGNVIQHSEGRVGGDVMVIGGSYRPESDTPLREAGKQTLVVGVFEDQIRDLAQRPSQLLVPTLTWGFLAQRVLLSLFWFVISLLFTTVAPGAVGRAVARVNLTSLKVTALGSVAFVLTLITIVGSVSVLPDYLSVTFGLMGMALLLFGYVFGRVTLQVGLGKFVQRKLLSELNRSETIATLIGVLIWTTLLSLPYVWIVALFTVFAIGIGLILTARAPSAWQKA